MLPVPKRSGDVSDAALIDLYDIAPPPGGRLVRLNMVSTLDGAATGQDGLSGTINTPSDSAVFALLRAWADVILVGAGTVRAESYAPAVVDERWRSLREDREAHPTIAVVTRSGIVPSRLRTEGEGGPVILLTTTDADPDAVAESGRAIGTDHVVQQGDSSVDLAASLGALAERGLTRVLCEGGPTLAGELVTLGLVDELCLTWSPLLRAGHGPRILDSEELESKGALASLLHEDDTLIGRWRIV
ncbi:dihydrofolate reductase family protein [Luteipulveratus mongoliensis]|uniref:dihydrofolate reductase family protein n=1 Tax=Luteipulveratus mongoliensis TaxID=571913 RepID=UPI0014708350|nr:dihydrofolate reductase family protein [Luteipulveratus mongoliensis]